jgi:hypothetical protein
MRHSLFAILSGRRAWLPSSSIVAMASQLPGPSNPTVGLIRRAGMITLI